MRPLAIALERTGFAVINLGYPSRRDRIEALAEQVRAEISTVCAGIDRIHGVTHSMGGILLRQIQSTAPLPNLGRVVMLAPPNQGGEVVDRIGHWPLFRWINGPAGQQLGTRPGSLPRQLGPVDFACGILAGNRSINWINSLMIPGPNDGKVSTENAKVEGMADYRVLPATHPMIMRKAETQRQVIHFLRHGRFA